MANLHGPYRFFTNKIRIIIVNKILGNAWIHDKHNYFLKLDSLKFHQTYDNKKQPDYCKRQLMIIIRNLIWISTNVFSVLFSSFSINWPDLCCFHHFYTIRSYDLKMNLSPSNLPKRHVNYKKLKKLEFARWIPCILIQAFAVFISS